MLKIFILFLTVSIVLAIERYEGNSVHPDHRGKCFYKEHGGTPIEVGQVYFPMGQSCERITCREDFVLRFESCGRYNVGLDCKKIDVSNSQPFPLCCGYLECKENGEVQRVQLGP